MAHPSFSDGDDGSRQRAWTKTLRALRHFAADRIGDEKLMERGFRTQWDNRNASKARAFRKKVEDHADQRLVDYLATQVRTNGAWKARDKEGGERIRAQWEDLIPQAREWLDEQNPDTQVNILHINNLSSMATGIFLVHPRNLEKILQMRSSRPLAAVVPGTIDRVKEATTLVVQDKAMNRTDERGRLSPVTLIQLGPTRIVKTPKVVDLALDEKPTVELTVDYVQILGMRVDWEQVLQDVFAALTARIQVANPETTILARYGKRIVKNDETEESTGFAQMIIRVQEEVVLPLLRNSGKNGLFVRQTHRTSQDPTQLEALGVGENYVIWMPMDHMLMEAQKASADLPGCMGLAWRLQWNKQVRLGVRVGPAGLEEARKRFHDQDERFNDSNRGVPVRTT